VVLLPEICHQTRHYRHYDKNYKYTKRNGQKRQVTDAPLQQITK